MTIQLTVFLLLAIAALIISIMSSLGKAPLYIAVILLAIIELVRAIPLGH